MEHGDAVRSKKRDLASTRETAAQTKGEKKEKKVQENKEAVKGERSHDSPYFVSILFLSFLRRCFFGAIDAVNDAGHHRTRAHNSNPDNTEWLDNLFRG